MEQGLTLGLQQKLVMTQQLRQAIEILQLSSQELSALIETEFLENPALEMEPAQAEESLAEPEEAGYQFGEIGALAKYLEGAGRESGAVNRDPQEKDSFELRAAVRPSLLQVLEMQVETAAFSDRERRIALYLIGCIDEHGYLAGKLDEIAVHCGVPIKELETVLHVIQGFEPDGVGARDLKECLEIQAKQQGIFSGLTEKLISFYLDELAAKKYKAIAMRENCTAAAVQEAAQQILKLNPKPGLGFQSGSAEYIFPDVIVRKINSEFVIIVNDYDVPRLSINHAYRNAEKFDAATKKYIEGRVNAAAWLLKSIEQRRSTLYKFMEAVIEFQRDFFERGHKYMRPLQMKTIAEKLGVHESTISRTAANKYVQTPFGCVSLKSFFKANLSQSGEELIAAQVQAAIRSMIEGEDPRKPFSDQQITEQLMKQDMKISRRTVAKYREQMGILSSSKRKVYRD